MMNISRLRIRDDCKWRKYSIQRKWMTLPMTFDVTSAATS